ncbi:hypothetical protein ACTA71_009367 [Dictyostelium dimigraforme]
MMVPLNLFGQTPIMVPIWSFIVDDLEYIEGKIKGGIRVRGYKAKDSVAFRVIHQTQTGIQVQVFVSPSLRSSSVHGPTENINDINKPTATMVTTTHQQCGSKPIATIPHQQRKANQQRTLTASTTAHQQHHINNITSTTHQQRHINNITLTASTTAQQEHINNNSTSTTAQHHTNKGTNHKILINLSPKKPKDQYYKLVQSCHWLISFKISQSDCDHDLMELINYPHGQVRDSILNALDNIKVPFSFELKMD